MTRRILILHNSTPYSRATTVSHLMAFSGMDGVEAHFHSMNMPSHPDLETAKWDAIILNYCFFMQRQAAYEALLTEPFMWIAKHPAIKIALPMDDCYRSGYIEEWCFKFNVSVVYTALYEHRALIYPNLTREMIIRPALTGYVDLSLLPKIETYRLPWEQRTIDVGTRVARSPAAHGKYASFKADYSCDFALLAEKLGLNCDISTDGAKAFVGMDWFRFVGQCKATIGMKGGYGLIDPRGDLRRDSTVYLAENPDASYEQIAAACFRGHDHLAEYSCISPRLFECAMMHTVQIMPPSNYLECLSPWKHYIPLSQDFTEIVDVADALRDKALCESIAADCYDVLIREGWFEQKSLTEDILTFIPDSGRNVPAPNLKKYQAVIEGQNNFTDKIGEVLSITLGYLFLYLKIYKLEMLPQAVFKIWNSSDITFFDFDDLSHEEFDDFRQNWFTSVLVAQSNLMTGLGMGSEMMAHLSNMKNNSFGALAYWPSAFSSAAPHHANDSDNRLRAMRYRHQFAELCDAYLAASSPQERLRSQTEVALFHWAKGDYATAEIMMLDVLETASDSANPEDRVLFAGVHAASLFMAKRTNDQKKIELLSELQQKIAAPAFAPY
jgi:hypothetical protein